MWSECFSVCQVHFCCIETQHSTSLGAAFFRALLLVLLFLHLHDSKEERRETNRESVKDHAFFQAEVGRGRAIPLQRYFSRVD